MRQGIRTMDLSWQPDEVRKPILDKVNVEIHAGAFYGILGPNGSGKTSLLRHLLRYLKAESGSVLLGDEDINDMSRKDLALLLSHVPQNTNVDATFSVYDIIMMGRSPYQKRFSGTTNKDREEVENAMELMNCVGLKDKPITKLSGGEAQRVVAARAIAQDTPYIFLDEPISHLDIRYQIELMEALKKLNEERKTTVIAVLHDINMAAKYCKKIILMKDGVVFAAGNTEEVLTVENLKKVYDISFVKCAHPKTGEPYFIPE